MRRQLAYIVQHPLAEPIRVAQAILCQFDDLLAIASWATLGRLVYLRAARVISNAILMTRLASGSNLKPSKNLVVGIVRSRLQAGARWGLSATGAWHRGPLPMMDRT